ncbi:MAG: fibronectin type III domain-containing protein, partial [Rudaea sp.]
MNRVGLFLIVFFLLALTPIRLSAAWPQDPPPCTTARPPSTGAGPGSTVCTSITYNQALGTTSIAVSWISRSAETGSVNVLNLGSYFDSRGANYSGTTHFVELRDLDPDTAYSFD